MPKRLRAHVNPLSILKEYSFEGFKNNNPIIIDVGACKGEFSETLVYKFWDKNFIIFEIRVPLARKLTEKFKKYPNVKVFDGDAGRNFKAILKPSLDRGVKIETIYVNFPDPWFKVRHKKRRFINSKFLETVSDYLPVDTEFVFQTDQKFLFDETLEILQKSLYRNIQFFSEPPYGIRTDWEKAKIAEGKEIYRMRFKQGL